VTGWRASNADADVGDGTTVRLSELERVPVARLDAGMVLLPQMGVPWRRRVTLVGEGDHDSARVVRAPRFFAQRRVAPLFSTGPSFGQAGTFRNISHWAGSGG